MGSTLGNDIKDLDAIYSRLVQYIDQRLSTSRFLIIGTSLGGYLARAHAQHYTQQVDSLLLLVPVVETNNARRDLDVFQPIVTDKELMATIHVTEKSTIGDVLIQTQAYLKALKSKIEIAELPALKKANNELLDPILQDPDRYRLSHVLTDTQTKLAAPTLIICVRQDDTVG